MKSSPKHSAKQVKEKRTHRVVLLLNDSEYRALQRYCDKYTVHSRSRLIRETLIRNILHRFDLDNPTLFDHDNNFF